MRLNKYLLESMSRYCHFYMAKDKNWYMELASNEHGEERDATTYGPFNTYEDAVDYLDQFANPGGWSRDKSGKASVPKKSPNGRPIEEPRKNRGW